MALTTQQLLVQTMPTTIKIKFKTNLNSSKTKIMKQVKSHKPHRSFLQFKQSINMVTF